MASVPFLSASPARSGADRHYEWQYLDLMRRVWEQGSERIDRTGIGTRSIFGPTMRFDLGGNRMPLITTKRVYWKTATREMLWFLTGETNIRPLLEQGVTIWSDWPLARYRRETGETIAQDAFEQRIVADADFAARWGDLGPVYGKQWVDWPSYEPVGEGKFRKGPGINQDAPGRREPAQEPRQPAPHHRRMERRRTGADGLAACHKTYQFHVSEGRLNGLLFQRSCDVALSLPYFSGVATLN